MLGNTANLTTPPVGSKASEKLKPAKDPVDELCPRAELFRSKLIGDFHLLESLDESGHVDAPKHYSKDIIDTVKLNRIMREGATSLVKFQVYSSKDKSEIKMNDRRKNRVRNKNKKTPPLDMWAHFILETSIFQNFMLALILANSIALGVQSEISDREDPSLDLLRTVLDVFDYCSLMLFMIEIILKWMDDFSQFWKSGWNIFDFIVTVGSCVPEILAVTAGGFRDLSVVVSNLRVFRVLRSLKMVSRFRQARLIALAITKAFEAMTFIMLLLMLFAYIFAIAGVYFFEKYSRSEREDLLYTESFSSLPRAFVTLIQLFTLDQWFKVLNDMRKVVDVKATVYVITWICIGSFIFRNIFAGIMVNNFQSIRNELFEEVKEQEEVRKLIQNTEKFNEELQKQDEKLNRARKHSSLIISEHGIGGEDTETEEDTEVRPPSQSDNFAKIIEKTSTSSDVHELSKVISQHLVEAQDSSINWEKTVHGNLEVLARTPTETLWPRDTLFRYFQLMESLQENLQERQDLLDLSYHSILEILDS
ncbi:cation channel sperm-associated protein 2-like [Ptychodera flava]|uniref:cation channel sperm-associated protein 2-like n=1 Tax=Ptychodera flava TaxID=63121 RepID=UPI003969C973